MCVYHRRRSSLKCGGNFSQWGRPLFKNTGGMTNRSNIYIIYMYTHIYIYVHIYIYQVSDMYRAIHIFSALCNESREYRGMSPVFFQKNGAIQCILVIFFRKILMYKQLENIYVLCSQQQLRRKLRVCQMGTGACSPGVLKQVDADNAH